MAHARRLATGERAHLLAPRRHPGFQGEDGIQHRFAGASIEQEMRRHAVDLYPHQRQGCARGERHVRGFGVETQRVGLSAVEIVQRVGRRVAAGGPQMGGSLDQFAGTATGLCQQSLHHARFIAFRLRQPLPGLLQPVAEQGDLAQADPHPWAGLRMVEVTLLRVCEAAGSEQLIGRLEILHARRARFVQPASPLFEAMIYF